MKETQTKNHRSMAWSGMNVWGVLSGSYDLNVKWMWGILKNSLWRKKLAADSWRHCRIERSTPSNWSEGMANALQWLNWSAPGYSESDPCRQSPTVQPKRNPTLGKHQLYRLDQRGEIPYEDGQISGQIHLQHIVTVKTLKPKGHLQLIPSASKFGFWLKNTSKNIADTRSVFVHLSLPADIEEMEIWQQKILRRRHRHRAPSLPDEPDRKRN